MTLFCDAHLHSSHPPFPKIEGSDPEALYLSCAAGPDDWPLLLKTRLIIPFLGLHPEKISSRWPDIISLLEQFIKDNPKSGVGECGLDRRLYKTIPRKIQEDVLARQIRIAVKYDRPVVLHQVGAPGALADVLNSERAEIPMMIHGFKESGEILERYIRLGLYISLGPGRHWEDEGFLNTARRIPREKLLLETDWPYCPHNGTAADNRCPKPYSDCLSEHYRRVSHKLGIDINTLSRLVKENGTLFTN